MYWKMKKFPYMVDLVPDSELADTYRPAETGWVSTKKRTHVRKNL